MKKSGKNTTGKPVSEDAALFRAAVGELKLLPEQNRVTPQLTRRKAVVRRHDAGSQRTDPLPDDHPADRLSDHAPEITAAEYLRNGLSRMTLRKLRRGTWRVQDSLDLHGNDTEAARKLLQQFLHEATGRNLRCVLVIHGKGLNSRDGEAVLRKLTRHWLTQHRQVLGYCNAQPAEGGSGAVLVLLKTGT
ncbi:MAG: Smr/MutS family protein [Gallionella sp.]